MHGLVAVFGIESERNSLAALTPLPSPFNYIASLQVWYEFLQEMRVLPRGFRPHQNRPDGTRVAPPSLKDLLTLGTGHVKPQTPSQPQLLYVYASRLIRP